MCSEKPIKTGGFDKICLKCDFEIEGTVYGRKQSDLCSLALTKPPGYKITRKFGPNYVKENRKSDLNMITVSVEDDDGSSLISMVRL